MKTTIFLSICLASLFSSSNSIKIRIPTGDLGPNNSSYHPSGPAIPSIGTHPYHLIKTCDSITPQISGADLLAYYSQDFYNGLANLHRKIVIVRHEIQRYVEYSYHRIVYQMDNTGYGSTYIALKIKVSLQMSVSIVSYVQSSNFSEIVSMMGFPDNQMFSYPCGNLQSQCVQAFTKMVHKVNICNSPGGYGSPSYLPQPQSHGHGRHRGKGRRKRFNHPRRRRRREKWADQSYDSFDDLDSHGLDDGPFKEVNATIDVTDGHGRKISIGSSRP